MDKEKQIEKIAFQEGLVSVIQSIFELVDWSGETKTFEEGVKEVCDRYSLFDCEDSVVLTEEEAERFRMQTINIAKIKSQERKETTDKILNELHNLVKNNEDFGRGAFGWETEEILMLLRIYADKQGVEIKGE